MKFYFDVISPYAYLAWTQIHDLAACHGRIVQPVPALFAAMLDHWGHRGPAEIPPKRDYVFKNVARLAHGLGVAVAPPPAHPFNSLLALRVASVDMEPEVRDALIDGLFRAVWVQGTGVTDPEMVLGVLASVGLDGAATVQAATSRAGKARVREQTDAAVAAGVFGVPTMVVDGELFWGVDSLDHLDAFLAGADPVSPELVAGWANLPAQAQRPASVGPRPRRPAN